MDALRDESRRTLLAIADKYAMPDYVKSADLMTKESAAPLPDALFADPVHRAFPVDCPANVWLSAAYFKETAHDIKSAELRGFVGGEIIKAADTLGLLPDVDALINAAAGQDYMPEADESNYCLKRGERRMFPVFDAEGVKRACDYFERHRAEFDQAERATIARNILRKAAQHQVKDVPSFIERESGSGMCDRAVMLDELLERARMTKDAESAMVTGALVEAISMATPEELMGGALTKIGELVEQLDTLNNMADYVGSKVTFPADFLFSMDAKRAMDLSDDAVHLNRHTFSAKRLCELGPEFFKGAMGDEFVTTVSENGALDPVKLASVVATLPRPDKTALEEYIVASSEE